MVEQAENFIFYRSFYEAISEFSNEDRLALYDALVEFAFEGTETEFSGMKRAILSMAMPLITASIKNYQKGIKGGRPKKETATGTREVSNSEISNFMSDYQTYKNSEYEFSDEDIELIRKTLSKTKEYDKEYWVKVFQITKIGYEIDGKIIPCQLKKLLAEHNKIHAGEIKFAPDKEFARAKKEEKEKEKELKKKQELEQYEQDLQEREQERELVNDAITAVEFLNKYIPKSLLARQVSSDYKEFKAMYCIELNEKTLEYETY